MDVKEKKMEESFKYHIPEDIPANERTAFHGAAAAAAKDGKKSFNFGGKTHPVTMNKDLANKIADQKEALDKKDVKTVKGVIKGLKKAVATHSGQVKTLTKDIKDEKQNEAVTIDKERMKTAKHNQAMTNLKRLDKKHSDKDHIDHMKVRKAVDNAGQSLNKHGAHSDQYKTAYAVAKHLSNKHAQKESTMTFREKLMSLYEGDRKAHYKGATEPEGMHDKSKSSKGAMDMINTPKEVAADGKKVNDDNAAKAAEKKMGRAKKRSGGDNVSGGDQKIVPGGTPMKEPAMAKEEYGMFGKKVNKNLLDAVNQVTELSKKTLGSYADKAAKQISKTLTDPNRKPTDKFGHSSQLKKRERGMDSATLKRNKERGKERLIHDLGMRPGKAAPAKARNS